MNASSSDWGRGERGGGSDGEMSTTNLFNSLILHFNPSLIPSIFCSEGLLMPVKERGEEDSKQRKSGIKNREVD